MKHIHISDVLTYKTCRRAWNWSSPLRSNLEPNAPYAPFYVGQAVHYATENLYRDGIPLRESAERFIASQAQRQAAAGPTFSLEEEDQEDQAELIFGMLEHYELWRKKYSGPFNDAELEIIPKFIEYEFKTALLNPDGKKSNKVGLSGRIDGLALHKPTGKYWIIEYKTCRSLAERARLLPFDEQASAYLVALPQVLDLPIEGILYTLLRKKSPTKPRVLQDGSLSNAKNIDTSLEMFVQHARQHYGDTSDEWLRRRHPDVINALHNNPHRFIWRVPLRRTIVELQQAQRHLWSAAIEMTQKQPDTYPHGGFHCSFCRFRRPCEELNRGSNVDMTLQEEFRVKESYYGQPIDFSFESIPTSTSSHS